MKLSTFILDNMEPILQEWENFAKTIFPKMQQPNTKELRDHTKKMLLLIAVDLEQSQSNLEQFEKSKGLQPEADTKATPAREHGLSRMGQGFSMSEMVSEYRALRACVTKLFINTIKGIKGSGLEDLVRFNEAIDQALAESITQYTLSKEQQTHLFDSMLSTSPVLSYLLDLDGSFLYVNKAMTALYQKPAYELVGKAIYNFEMPSVADMREHIRTVIDNKKQLRGEMLFKNPVGKVDYFEYVFAPVVDKEGKIYAIAGTSRNITEQKNAEKQVWINANYDLLTGLPNRLMFRDKLEQALKHSQRTAEPFALLYIDLDKFKGVNDALGHDVGDHLLKQVATRMIACARDTDTIARMSGDEFTAILPAVYDVDQVKIVAEKIQAELSRPFKIKKKTLHISASIGITFSPQDGIKPDVLVGHADQAMYAAKKLGCNQICFYSGNE